MPPDPGPPAPLPDPLEQRPLAHPAHHLAVGRPAEVLAVVRGDDQVEPVAPGPLGGGGVDPAFDRGLVPASLDLAGLDRRAGREGHQRHALGLLVQAGGRLERGLFLGR